MSIVTLIVFLIFCIVVIVGIIEVQQGPEKDPGTVCKESCRKKDVRRSGNTHSAQSESGRCYSGNLRNVIPAVPADHHVLHGFRKRCSCLDRTNGFHLQGTPGVWVYAAFNVVLIIFFTYFYTSVTFNPVEVAQNMKANGGFIPGIRPGKATVEYLNRVMTRITFVGAVFLAAVAMLPTIVSQLGGLNFHFGGTSLLIAVGVALDTMKQLENQMVMRNYQGFLK